VARADTAGADYTLPEGRRQPAPAVTRSTPVPGKPAAQAAPVAATVPVSAGARMAGEWKLQLGAFGNSGNADRLASRLSGNAALGDARVEQEPAGRLTKVMAVGYPSRAAAQDACSALKRGGQDCLVTR
jgi:cell division protein FtsN